MKAAAIEPAASDEERIAACTAGDSSCLEVDEEKLPATGRSGKQAKPGPAFFRRQAVSDRDRSMTMARCVAAIDNEEAMRAGLRPFTVENGCGVHVTAPRLRRSVRRVRLIGLVALLTPADAVGRGRPHNPTQSIGDRVHADGSIAP